MHNPRVGGTQEPFADPFGHGQKFPTWIVCHGRLRCSGGTQVSPHIPRGPASTGWPTPALQMAHEMCTLGAKRLDNPSHESTMASCSPFIHPIGQGRARQPLRAASGLPSWWVWPMAALPLPHPQAKRDRGMGSAHEASSSARGARRPEGLSVLPSPQLAWGQGKRVKSPAAAVPRGNRQLL